MQKQLKNGKRKGLYGEVSGPKRVTKFLQPYFFQGGKWFKLKSVKGV